MLHDGIFQRKQLVNPADGKPADDAPLDARTGVVSFNLWGTFNNEIKSLFTLPFMLYPEQTSDSVGFAILAGADCLRGNCPFQLSGLRANFNPLIGRVLLSAGKAMELLVWFPGNQSWLFCLERVGADFGQPLPASGGLDFVFLFPVTAYHAL